MKKLKAMKKNLEKAIMAYINAFEKKHDVCFESATRNNLLDVLCFGDYYLNLQDIALDMDTKQPKNVFFDWYDAALDEGLRDSDRWINYEAWIMGLRYEDLDH